MLLSERQNGLKSRAFGDQRLSGSSFLCPIDTDIMTTAQMILATVTKKMTTPTEKTTTAEKKRQHSLTTATGNIKTYDKSLQRMIYATSRKNKDYVIKIENEIAYSEIA
jgi:hypothetical protein